MTGEPERPLWVPRREAVASAAITRFAAAASDRAGRTLADYAALHAWSVAAAGPFWDLVWDFCDVVGDKGDTILHPGLTMRDARFFPEGRLNFAENLLRRSGDGDALVFRSEGMAGRRISWRELRDLVSRVAAALRDVGVGPGDRVAAIAANTPETVAAFLAAASLGAIWSSCSPDFGVRGILDRFAQIEPTVLFACDGYLYAGRPLGLADKVREVAAALPSVRRVVVLPLLAAVGGTPSPIPGANTLDTLVADIAPGPIAFARLPFAHPLVILFSSGTTGTPKCIVHSAGGTLLQHLKEHQLHCDVRAGDRLFYYTTCGWMMWNWLVTGLASEATLLLYDGSPAHPDPTVLFDYAAAERATLFGTSAKFIDSIRKAGLVPRQTHDLAAMRTITSTGSPLSPEGFDYVYQAIGSDVHLASISGGTDVISCFVLGVPTLPLWRGEIQAAGLGMAVDVWDEAGRPVRGEKGELVCTAPFPSMPISFWNDPGDARYRAAYFDRFPDVWCHGDFAEWTTHGGIVIHGRSDATLNPGGVRIGTAEIYNQVEQVPEVLEALAIAQDWDSDVRVVLFVRLRQGATLDAGLEQTIRTRIRTGASPRHVPARIVAVADIPRTKSGKIVELAVREAVHGRAVKNVEALANPEALDQFRNRPELAV